MYLHIFISNSIYMQIHKKWSETEIDELRKDYGILSPNQLEEKYKRKYRSIRSTATRYGIKSQRYTGKRKYWTEKETENLIYEWKNTSISVEDLAKKYDRSKESIRNKIRECKVKREHAWLSSEEKEYILNNYGKNGSSKIADDIGRSQHAVLSTLKDNNIKILKCGTFQRKYNIDETYFDKGIDTSIKAYIFGFFLADGCNTKRKQISVCLKEEDTYILDKMCAEMKNESPIKKIFNKKYERYYSRMNIYNAHISDKLNELGMVPNKSLIIKPPQIRDELFFDFLRGVSDGDGNISIFRRNSSCTLHWSLATGSYDFATWIKNTIYRLIKININLYCRDNIYILNTSSIVSCMDIFQKMYENTNGLYLKRKFNKILEWAEMRIDYEQNYIYVNGSHRQKIISEQTRWSILQ